MPEDHEEPSDHDSDQSDPLEVEDELVTSNFGILTEPTARLVILLLGARDFLWQSESAILVFLTGEMEMEKEEKEAEEAEEKNSVFFWRRGEGGERKRLLASSSSNRWRRQERERRRREEM